MKLQYVPDAVLAFPDFLELYNKRREAMKSRLRAELGMGAVGVVTVAAAAAALHGDG